MTEIIACWDKPAETDTHVAWVHDAYHRLAPLALPGGYVSLMGREEQDRVKEAYGSKCVRLQELKRKYDPEDVFHSFGHINP